jgi:hypothetical protein
LDLSNRRAIDTKHGADFPLKHIATKGSDLPDILDGQFGVPLPGASIASAMGQFVSFVLYACSPADVVGINAA